MWLVVSHTVGQPADQSTDIDCRGFWTPCTGACEKSSQRTYEVKRRALRTHAFANYYST